VPAIYFNRFFSGGLISYGDVRSEALVAAIPEALPKSVRRFKLPVCGLHVANKKFQASQFSTFMEFSVSRNLRLRLRRCVVSLRRRPPCAEG
jgi:hypothetical protein